MGLNDVVWIDTPIDTAFVSSGTFTDTIKTSINTDTAWSFDRPFGIGFDSVDTSAVNRSSPRELIWASGQFTSTIKAQVTNPSGTEQPSGISDDKTPNTLWCSRIAGKLFLNAGKVTSTILDSVDVTGTIIEAISALDIDTAYGRNDVADKRLLLQSGRYTSTVKVDFDISALLPGVIACCPDPLNTYTSNATDTLFYLSGVYSSTIKETQAIFGAAGIRSVTTVDHSRRLHTQLNLFMELGTNMVHDPYPSGRIVKFTINNILITTALELTWEDINNLAVVLVEGERLIITDIIVANTGTAKRVTLFQSNDGDDALDAGEELITLEFSGQGSASVDLSTPLATAKVNAAGTNDLFIISSAAGEVSVTINGRINRA